VPRCARVETATGAHGNHAYGANPLLSMYNPRYLRRT